MEAEIKFNYKKALKLTLNLLVILCATVIVLKLAVFFLPFVIAFIISKIISHPVDLITKKFHLPRTLAVIISLLGFIAIISGVVYFFVAALFREIISLAGQTNYIFPLLYNNINDLISRFNFFYQNLNLAPDMVQGIQDSVLGIINSLLTSLSSGINAAANAAVNIIVSLPNIIIYIIITLLSTFFISNDSKFISDSLEKHIPLKWLIRVQSVINDLFHALGGYLKAQGILITITFCELLIGLSLFKVRYALILAIVIAIIDALPILGTGTVLIPWAIVSVVMGNYKFAVCIFGLYLFILVVRQLIEPKIVGTQIGIYPLLTLIAMYTGTQFAGIWGLILGPIVLIVLKNILGSIYESGALKEIFDGRDLTETSKKYE